MRRGRARTLALLPLLPLLLSSCRMTGTEQVTHLDEADRVLPHRFTLVNWNAQKKTNSRVTGDLEEMLREWDPDILFLQEAKPDVLLSGTAVAHFARSWRYPWPGGDTVGVLNASKVRPLQVRALPTRHREFGVTAPKVSLATHYPLPDGQTLLAVNVHCLNFERWNTDKLDAQLEDMHRIMEEHVGPILLAGDFNTWSAPRYAQVRTMARALGLKEVTRFSGTPKTGDRGSKTLNQVLGIDKDLALDRIFYRGMRCESAHVLEYNSSDHLALAASFILSTDRAETLSTRSL